MYQFLVLKCGEVVAQFDDYNDAIDCAIGLGRDRYTWVDVVDKRRNLTIYHWIY